MTGRSESNFNPSRHSLPNKERTMRIAKVPLTFLALALCVSISKADDPKPKPNLARAPGDSQIFESDMAGAYFIARPLQEQYEALQKRVAALKVEVREARIDSGKARVQVAALQAELKTLLEKIQATKVYVPGAAIQTRTETSTLALAAADLLLIDAENVEIRGWEGPGIECVLEKTVLDQDGTKFAADFEGIKLVAREESGGTMFGYYVDILKRPGGQVEWDRFPFQDYVKAKFAYITIQGLTGQEGNEQISLKMLNEEGSGQHSSEWRRHARLVLKVPRCRKVAVRGALGRFKVDGLNAPLVVQGTGNRDYAATYEVTNLGGPLKGDNIPIHRLDGIKGDVSIVATTYNENWSSANGPDGHWDRTEGPRPSLYRNIQGELKAKFIRADLTLEKLQGRVDVENEFGNTTWTIDAPLPQKQDHRLVSQSGAIDLQFDPKALGDLTLSLYTECGLLHLPEGIRGFDDQSFSTSEGDEFERSWQAEVRRKDPNQRPDIEERFAGFSRPADILRGRPRSPGVDILSRGGIITASPVK
jgi:hypothetical protein